MGDGRIEIGFRLELGFDGAHKAFEAAQAVDFVVVADLCAVKGVA